MFPAEKSNLNNKEKMSTPAYLNRPATHNAALVLNQFLDPRKGHAECEWDDWLTKLISSIPAKTFLTDECSARLKETIGKIKNDRSKNVQFGQAPLARWIARGCPII